MYTACLSLCHLAPCAYQTTVDGDALLGPFTRGPCSLQPLGASQIHKVKLSSERLILGARGGRSIRKPSHRLIHLQQNVTSGSPKPYCCSSAGLPPHSTTIRKSEGRLRSTKPACMQSTGDQTLYLHTLLVTITPLHKWVRG